MPLETAGDEAVLGADEMQNLDHRLVGRHRAASREGDREHGGGDHQEQNRDAGGYRGSRHGAHAVDPAAMIVERGARHLLGQHPSQLRNVGRGAVRDLDHDQARHRQFVELEPVAEPRLEQLGGFLFRISPHVGDAGKGARGRRRIGRGGIEIAAGRRDDLDGHLTRHVGLPFARRAGDQYHRAGGERRQERHDGDDRDQRAPGDRVARHQRRFETRQQATRRRRHVTGIDLRHVCYFDFNHRCADALHAAPAGAHRTGPSARCRGWRSPPRFRIC